MSGPAGRGDMTSRILQETLERLPAAVILTDPMGRIIYVNPWFCRTSGYAREEVIGQTPGLLKSGVHPPEFYGEMWQTILAGNVWQGEICNRRKDGSLFWEVMTIAPVVDEENKIAFFVAGKFDITEKKRAEEALEQRERTLLVSAAPLPDRGGMIGQSVLVVRDLTDQKRQEEELRTARDGALAAAELRTEFLANVSHELRTPMNAILGLAEVLRDEELPARATDTVEDIRRAAHDLLDFSRIESGKMEFEEAPFCPQEILVEVVQFFRPAAEKKGLRLESRLEGESHGTLIGDAKRFRQVLVNLVGNAVKFTESGHVDVRQIVRRREDGEGWILQLEVADTGPGIPPEVGERIFDPFRQADGSLTRDHGGSGLGLAITRKLVEMQGGKISFESTPGRGTVFRVEIPYRGDDERQQGESRGTIVVLVVEDNPVNRKVAGRLLERRGHVVRYAENGAEVLARLREEAVDLVLMDIQMPEMDGLEATRRIRAGEVGEAFRHVPVVALTARVARRTGGVARRRGWTPSSRSRSTPISCTRRPSPSPRPSPDVPGRRSPGAADLAGAAGRAAASGAAFVSLDRARRCRRAAFRPPVQETRNAADA